MKFSVQKYFAACIALAFSACHGSHDNERTGSLSETASADATQPPAPDATQPPAPETPAAVVAAKYVPKGDLPLPKGYEEPPSAVKNLPSWRSICGSAPAEEAEAQKPLLAVLKEAGLSAAYTNNCADCHGYIGEGRGTYPRLNQLKDRDALMKVVRSGKGLMPAFGVGLISNSDLNGDAGRLVSGEIAAATAPIELSDILPAVNPGIQGEEYAAAMRTGLPAWRNPGDSCACAACHGPDGIDLARIGYSNATILRRAILQGRTPAEGLAIVAMIAAERRRYEIDRPCSPTNFRPLQPAGAPLAKMNADDTDTALRAELTASGLAFDPGALASVIDARAFIKALAAIEPGSIKIGIAMNPWTADSFHGEERKSSAEWIPELPMEPSSDDLDLRWNDLQDRYLESPSAKNLWAMYDAVEGLSAARFVDSGIAQRISREKFRAVLVMQHMMRVNDRTLPDLRAAKDLNRFSVWETAQVASVMLRGCGNDGPAEAPYPCWNYLPKFFAKMGTDRDALMLDAKRMILPWLTAGFLLDPALQFTENGDAQMLHWHDAFREADSDLRAIVPGSLPFHQLYFASIRMAKAMEGFDPYFSNGRGFEKKTMNGCWNAPVSGLAQWQSAALPALAAKASAASAVFAVNKAVLFLVEEALARPDAACKATADRQKMLKIVLAIGAWGNEKTDAFNTKALAAKVATALK